MEGSLAGVSGLCGGDAWGVGSIDAALVGGGQDGKDFTRRTREDDGAPRSWAAGVSSATRNPLARSVPRTSAVLTFEITAAYDGFPATCREGVRRVTVAPQHRKESNADAERRCTQNTLMLPCGSKTVAHAFDIDGHALPASNHRRSRGPVPIRVFCVHRLAASALRFLLCGAADRCWRTHCQARVGAHASGATPWHSACMAPRLVAANGCAAFSSGFHACIPDRPVRLADAATAMQKALRVQQSVSLRLRHTVSALANAERGEKTKSDYLGR